VTQGAAKLRSSQGAGRQAGQGAQGSSHLEPEEEARGAMDSSCGECCETEVIPEQCAAGSGIAGRAVHLGEQDTVSGVRAQGPQ